MPLFSRVTIYKDDDVTKMVTLSTDPSAVPATDAVLYLPLDGNTNDLSGNGNNGTLMDGASYVAGQVGQAVLLDGLNDRVHVPDVATLKWTGQDFGAFARVNPDATDADGGGIISKAWNGGGQYNWEFFWNPNGSLALTLSGATLYNLVTAAGAVSAGTWHEVGFTIDSTTKLVVIWADGKIVASGTHAITSWVPSGGDINLPLVIGSIYPYGAGWAGVTGQALKGMIEEVRVYNKDLAPEFIVSLGAFTGESAYPYLQDSSLMYGESKINFPEGSAGIGQFGFSVLDKRKVYNDQTTGFFTELLADAGGRGNILGHRVVWERQQIGGGGAYVTQFDGIADDCQLDTDLVEYRIPCRDVRERERTNRIFTKHNQGTSLVPNGPVNGWGSVPGTSLKLIPPVTPLRGQFWRDPNIPATAGRVKCTATQFDLIITGSRYQALQNYGALTQGSGLTGGDTSLAFRNVIIWWRAYPGGGAWTVLQNMPAVVGTDYAMNNVFPLGQGTFEGAENRSFVPKNQKELANFLVNMTGPGIPAHLQQIEFMVLAAGQPTEDAPIYWEGNLGQLTKEIYDGTWSNYLPGIRYDAAAMTTFINRSVQGAALITAPVENGLQWVQENTYKPQGWAPSVPPETGLVTPIQYNLPTATEPLINLTDSIVKEDAKWELAKDELINSVTFQYDAVFIRDSKYITNFADKLGLNANLIEPPAQRIGTLPVIYNEIAVNSQALLGAKDLSYKPETIKLFGILTPNGLDTRLWPDVGSKLAKDRTKEVLDRFTFAGQRLTANARRTGTGIATAKMGNWVLCGVSWLPDYVSKKRGLNRIMQIVSVNDDDKVFRKFVLSDAGPNVVPSSAPVIGAITQLNGVIDIPFTSIPAGVYAKIDFALSTLEPAADSGLWTNAGRTNVATDHITIGPLPPGTSVWIRAVGEEPGKRRSAFTASQNITITNSPYILGVQITFDADGHARANWTNSSSTLGVRIQYVVHDATVDPPAFTGTLDADATLAQVQLPVIPGFGQAITVKLTPYPAFAAGAVSGTAGPATNSITVRNFGTATDVSLPTVQEQTSSTSTLGTLTLVINDPQLRVTKVEFATQQNNGAWSAWVQDSVLPYAASVTIPAGGTAKVGYRVTGYDKDGVLNVLTQSEVSFAPATLGVPQPPWVSLVRSGTTAPTVANETVNINAGLGQNGVGPIQWRMRTYADTALPPAWGAFSASPILPVDATVTRGLKYQKVLNVQVTDASGVVAEEVYFIESRMDYINGNGDLDDSRPMSSGTPPFRRTIDTAVDVISTSSRGFIDQAGLDLSLRPTSIFRGAGYEAATNLFKRGTDTVDDVFVTGSRAFVHVDQTDATIGGGRIINLKRTGINTESVDNMFKRGSNTAADVVITSVRTFVDPNSATQVDASGRIVGVFRLGVYESVNNLVKFGDGLGVATASSLTLIGGSAFQIVMSGGPTGVLQIAVGDSSVFGAIGSEYSSGAQFHSYNAYQTAKNTDSWNQSLGSLASNMIEIDVNGFNVYTAAAGHSAGTKAAFWTLTAYIAAGGSIGGKGQLRMGNLGGTNGVAGDIIAARSTTAGAYYFGNDTTAYIYFNGTHFYFGSGAQGLVVSNYGSGLVGLYDATKYRLIYAIGDSYMPNLAGTVITGSYGLFFIYDQTSGGINITGGSGGGLGMSHGVAMVDNGSVKAIMATKGFWTSGDYWVAGTRVAKIQWGAGAPAGAPDSGIGTIYFQTS